MPFGLSRCLDIVVSTLENLAFNSETASYQGRVTTRFLGRCQLAPDLKLLRLERACPRTGSARRPLPKGFISVATEHSADSDSRLPVLKYPTESESERE